MAGGVSIAATRAIASAVVASIGRDLREVFVGLGPQDHVRLAVGTEPPQVPSGPFGVGGPTEHQLVTLGHPGRRVELLGPGESQSGSPVVPSAATQTKLGWFPPVPVAKTIRVPAWVHTG